MVKLCKIFKIRFLSVLNEINFEILFLSEKHLIRSPENPSLLTRCRTVDSRIKIRRMNKIELEQKELKNELLETI